MIGCTLSVSLVLGPILGGVISHLSSWRWIFDLKYVSPSPAPRASTRALKNEITRALTLRSIPVSAVTMVIMAMAWPTHENQGGTPAARYCRRSIKKIDFLGSATLLCACCLLIVGLQQAGAAHNLWSDSVIIAVLALSALSFIGFIAWQVVLNRGSFRSVKPIFPVNLLRNRVFAATLV